MNQQGWKDKCPKDFLGWLETGRHTSGYPEHPHDADDGGVDGQSRVHLDLLQRDPHDGQQDYGQVQLVPPTDRARTRKIPSFVFLLDYPLVLILVSIAGTSKSQVHLLILIWTCYF